MKKVEEEHEVLEPLNRIVDEQQVCIRDWSHTCLSHVIGYMLKLGGIIFLVVPACQQVLTLICDPSSDCCSKLIPLQEPAACLFDLSAFQDPSTQFTTSAAAAARSKLVVTSLSWSSTGGCWTSTIRDVIKMK